MHKTDFSWDYYDDFYFSIIQNRYLLLLMIYFKTVGCQMTFIVLWSRASPEKVWEPQPCPVINICKYAAESHKILLGGEYLNELSGSNLPMSEWLNVSFTWSWDSLWKKIKRPTSKRLENYKHYIAITIPVCSFNDSPSLVLSLAREISQSWGATCSCWSTEILNSVYLIRHRQICSDITVYRHFK